MIIFVAADEVFSLVATDEVCADSNFVEALNYQLHKLLSLPDL